MKRFTVKPLIFTNTLFLDFGEQTNATLMITNVDSSCMVDFELHISCFIQKGFRISGLAV